MRLLLAMGLVIVSSGPSSASSPDCASTPHHSSVISWRPQAWRPPVRTTPMAAGLRFEPEGGATQPTAAGLEALASARRQALESIPVRTRPDGSRYAVLGGLVRAYAVVHIGADGSLIQECVHSEEQARQRVAAPAGPKER